MTHSWGSKFVTIKFPFKTHTVMFVMALDLVDWTLYENDENWYPTKFKPFRVITCTTVEKDVVFLSPCCNKSMKATNLNVLQSDLTYH